jgi:hypothetical protein
VASCGGGHAQLQLINFDFNRTECLRLLRDHRPGISDEILAKVSRPVSSPLPFPLTAPEVNTFIHATVEGRTSECDSCRLQLVVLVSRVSSTLS